MLTFFRWIGRMALIVPRPLGGVLVCAWVLMSAWFSSWPVDPKRGEEISVFGTFLWESGHAPLYGGLAFWMLLAVPRVDVDGPAGLRRWPRLVPGSVVRVVAAVLIAGVVDEWHQGFTPGRGVSAADLLTNLTGASCVLWITAYLARHEASEVGLWRRLAAGVLLCAAAGGFSASLVIRARKTDPRHSDPPVANVSLSLDDGRHDVLPQPALDALRQRGDALYVLRRPAVPHLAQAVDRPG